MNNYWLKKKITQIISSGFGAFGRNSSLGNIFEKISLASSKLFSESKLEFKSEQTWIWEGTLGLDTRVCWLK